MNNFRSRRSKGNWPTTTGLLDLLAGKRRDEEQETGHRATRPSPWGSSTLALSTWGPYIFDKLYILHVLHFLNTFYMYYLPHICIIPTCMCIISPSLHIAIPLQSNQGK